MPARFRCKRRNAIARHKDRLVKTKYYTYHNPEDVKAKVNDEDVVGCGRYYCMFCCRHFESALVLAEHEASKIHKKNVKRKKFDQEMDAKQAKAKEDYEARRAKLSIANEIIMKEASSP